MAPPPPPPPPPPPLIEIHDLLAASRIAMRNITAPVPVDATAAAVDCGSGDSDDLARSDHTDNDSETSTSKKRSLPSHARVTPDSIDNAVTASSHQKPHAKQRKSTYAIRRDEKNSLFAEIATLEARLKALKTAAGQRDDESDADADRSNTLMRASICDHQLSLATTQSVVSGLLNREHWNPLSTCIRLGTDWDDRRRSLLAMKADKIRHACAYVAARSKFLDPLTSHTADERFETAADDYCCTRFEQFQFPNVASVKFVFDALVAYIQNIEISVSEKLGNITVRDDYIMIEDSIVNYRFLTNDRGVPVESHGVLFLQYFESHPLADGGPCGVVVVDCVDDDLLYPYTPTERVRKDVVSIKVLTPQFRSSASGDGSSELVVSMRQVKMIKLHHAACPLATPDAVARMRANITDWGDVIVQSLYDTVYQYQQK